MPDINGIIEFLKTQYASYGYLIVFLGAYLENTVITGLILPGGTLIVLGGVFAAQGTMSLPLVMLLAWMGMFLGSSTDYWIGRLGLWRIIEKTRLHNWLNKGLTEAKLLLIEKGPQTIFLAHFLGQIRTFMALTAGIVKMPFHKFALYELFASLFWSILYCGAGYLIGNSLDQINNLFTILAGVGLVVAVFAYWSWKKHRDKRVQAEEQALETTEKADSTEETPEKTSLLNK